MRIQIAKDKHIPEIIELWKESMDFHKNIDTYWSRREDGHSIFENLLRESLENEDAIVLAAVDNGHIVRYSRSWISKPPPLFERDSYGGIIDMAVTSDYRRRGIGELMLGKTLDSFASRNIDRIELELDARNQIGYSFWKKHGFQDFRHRLYLEKHDQR